MPDTATVRVVIHFDGDSEQHFLTGPQPDATDDGDAGSFVADVPAALWAAYEAAVAQWDEIVEEVRRIAGVDCGRKLEVCESWVGSDWAAGLPHPDPWWDVFVPRSGHPKPFRIRTFETEAEARNWVADLPARFHVLTGIGDEMIEVDRAAMTVEQQEPARRWWRGSCERCGWSYHEHPEQGG